MHVDHFTFHRLFFVSKKITYNDFLRIGRTGFFFKETCEKNEKQFFGIEPALSFFWSYFLKETMWVKEKNILVKIVRKNRRVYCMNMNTVWITCTLDWINFHRLFSEKKRIIIKIWLKVRLYESYRISFCRLFSKNK